MLELYLSKVTETSESEQAGKLYARVSYKQTLDVNGNTVKIDNLAIFKATVEANALETLYDADADKVASATIGVLAEGAKTGAAVKAVKLLAQSTGEFTRDELKKDAKLAWTDKAKARRFKSERRQQPDCDGSTDYRYDAVCREHAGEHPG